MSRKIKVVGLALVAVLAFSAIAASAAQAGAPHWRVAGTVLGSAGSKVVAGTGGAAGTSNTLSVPGLLELETAGANCTFTGNIIGSAANSPGTVTGHLHCTGVKVEKNANCKVFSDPGNATNGTVLTNELTGTLVWLAATGTANVGVTFKPESGTEFTKITIEECAVEGAYPVKGNVIATAAPIGVEATEGTLTSTGAKNPPYWTNQTPTRTKDEDAGLTFGTKEALLMGGFTVKLSPCELFGIFNG